MCPKPRECAANLENHINISIITCIITQELDLGTSFLHQYLVVMEICVHENITPPIRKHLIETKLA